MKSITLSETENSSVFSNVLTKEYFLKKIRDLKNIKNPGENAIKILVKGLKRLFKSYSANEDYFVKIFCEWLDLTLKTTTKWVVKRQWHLCEEMIIFLTKYFAAFCFVDSIFIQQKVFDYWIKFLEQLPENYRKQFVPKQNNVLIDLMSSIFISGHYLTQKMALSIFLKYAQCFEDKYQKILDEIFSNKNQKLKILLQNCNFSNIDVECRKFLNCFNMEVSEEMPVFSVIVNSVFLENIKVNPPMDNNKPTDFWVDFNSGMKSVSFFCSKTTFSDENVDDLINIEAKVLKGKIILDRNKSELIIEVDKFLNMEEENYIKRQNVIRLIRFVVNDNVFSLLRKSKVLQTMNGNKKVRVINANSQNMKAISYVDKSSINEKENIENNIQNLKNFEGIKNETFVTNPVDVKKDKFEHKLQSISNSKDNNSQINFISTYNEDDEIIFKKPNRIYNNLHLKRLSRSRQKGHQKLNAEANFSNKNAITNSKKKSVKKKSAMLTIITDDNFNSNKNTIIENLKNKHNDSPSPPPLDINIMTKSTTKAISKQPVKKTLVENEIITQNEALQAENVYENYKNNRKFHSIKTSKLSEEKEKQTRTDFKMNNFKIKDKKELSLKSVLPSVEDDRKIGNTSITEIISDQGYVGVKNLLNDDIERKKLNISAKEIEIVNSKLENVNSALERSSKNFFKTELFKEKTESHDLDCADIYEFVLPDEDNNNNNKKLNKTKKRYSSKNNKISKSKSNKNIKVHFKTSPTVCQQINKLNSKKIIVITDDEDIECESLHLFKKKPETDNCNKNIKDYYENINETLNSSHNKNQLKRKSNFYDVNENKKTKINNNNKSGGNNHQLSDEPEPNKSILFVGNKPHLEHSNEFDRIFDELKNEEIKSKAKIVNYKNELVTKKNKIDSLADKIDDIDQIFAGKEIEISSKQSTKIKNEPEIKVSSKLTESNNKENRSDAQINDLDNTADFSDYYQVSDESNELNEVGVLSDSLLNRFFKDLSSIPQNNIKETIYSNLDNFDNKNEKNSYNNGSNLHFKECVNLNNNDENQRDLFCTSNTRKTVETEDIEKKADDNTAENSNKKNEVEEGKKLYELKVFSMNETSLMSGEDEDSISKKRIKLIEGDSNYLLNNNIGCVVTGLNNAIKEMFRQLLQENNNFPEKLHTLKEIMTKYLIQYQNIMENNLKRSIRKIKTLTKNLNHENTQLLKSFISLKICIDEMFVYIKDVKMNSNVKLEQFKEKCNDITQQIPKKTKPIVTKKCRQYVQKTMTNLSYTLNNFHAFNLSLD